MHLATARIVTITTNRQSSTLNQKSPTSRRPSAPSAAIRQRAEK